MMRVTPRTLHQDHRGNIAMIGALVMIPMIALMGMGVDFTISSRIHAHLQDAADAAVLAGVQPELDNNRRATLANDVFKGNLAGKTDILNANATFTYAVSNNLISGKVTWQADQTLAFGGLFGKSTRRLTGQADAQVALKSFVDVEFWIDGSASMNIAADEAGRDVLRVLSKDDPEHANCAFACHLPTKMSTTTYATSQDRAHANGIKLRIDVIKEAASELFDYLRDQDNNRHDLRFRVASLTRTFSELESYLSTKDNVAAALSGFSLSTADPASRLVHTIGQGTAAMPNAGKGSSSADRARYVILATDGFQFDWDAVQSGGLPLGTCSALKAKGVIVAVIHTPYVRLDGDGAFETHVAPHYDEIVPGLTDCASPNYYFQANSSVEIKEAFEALRTRIVKDLHLTK